MEATGRDDYADKRYLRDGFTHEDAFDLFGPGVASKALLGLLFFCWLADRLGWFA
jgi:hypothetical protein